MPSTPILQCLFCHHLNPAGASFCNDCGSQLHLQPCDHCGAINKRSARSCYKCHAIFTLSAVHEFESAILGNNKIAAYPELNLAGTASEQSAQPPSAQQAFSTLHHELRPEGQKLLGRRSGVAARKAVLPNRLRAHSHIEHQLADETAFSDRGPAATRSHHTWRNSFYMLLLAAITSFVYYYSGPSTQRTPKQPVTPTAPSVARAPVPSASAPPTLAVQIETAPVLPAQSVTASAPPKTATSVSGFYEGVARAPTGAGTVTKQPPMPAVESEIPAQSPPASGECPEAVATLGLCSPIPLQERP